jgi:hypothetical protein
VAEGVRPLSDQHASGPFRLHLAQVLAGRALRRAAGRAAGAGRADGPDGVAGAGRARGAGRADGPDGAAGAGGAGRADGPDGAAGAAGARR